MISDNDGNSDGHDILSAGFRPFATMASQRQIAELGGKRSSFQLSEVCNTSREYFRGHNRAARKANLKMQGAPFEANQGTLNATTTNLDGWRSGWVHLLLSDRERRSTAGLLCQARRS
jgi:hypothetical protein